MLVLNAGDTLQGVASAATEVTYTINGMTLTSGTEAYDVLAQGQLAAAAAALYTVGGGVQAFVLSMHFVNMGTVPRTFGLFVNGTAASNRILPNITLRPGGWAHYTEYGGWHFSSDGAEAIIGMSGALLQVREIFRGTVTYVPSLGCKAMYIEAVGGGGGGGGNTDGSTNAAAAGGGGAGAYSAVFTTVIQNYVVAVGAGGAGGATGNNGTAGGDSTFGSILTADGGAGGILHAVQATAIVVGGLGGAGGLASAGVGDIKCDGEPGTAGVCLAAAQALGGKGGRSHFSGGANAVKTAVAGVAAAGYGSGGGGGVELSGGTARAGGAGSDGLIRVWEFS